MGYASVLIIRKLDKADGTPRGYRFVVDLRSRNETVRDIGNQLPEAATLFEYLCVSKVVSVYDVKDGYWNCPFAADPGRGEGGGRAEAVRGEIQGVAGGGGGSILFSSLIVFYTCLLFTSDMYP